MENTISKELLSDIYNFDVKDIISLGVDDVTYEVRFNGLRRGYKYDIINIHELVYKYRRWAYYKGYEIIVSYNGQHNNCPNFYYFLLENTWSFPIYTETIQHEGRAYTEEEAYIKSCQWIYDKVYNAKN